MSTDAKPESLPVRIGSLCSGYGGLDLGLVTALGGGEVAWHVEYDKHPSAILDARFPGVPNYGDLTTIDWASVEPVAWITAGYPCQPFSHAGKRKGSKDERHLWPFVARAIGALRPGRVLLENVAGHVSLGLDAVLGDLAALGYDATWGVVRASDAGAPHGRARIFVVAADTRRQRHGSRQDGRALGLVDGEDAGRSRQRQRARQKPVDRGAAAAADTDDGGSRHGRTREDGRGGSDHRVRAGQPAPDTSSNGRDEGRPEPAGIVGRLDAAERGDVATDTDSRPAEWELPRRLRAAGSPTSVDLPLWGSYESAIRRWEHITGRPAPRPTEPGRTGERLSPRFVEWLMGLPAGWVTDVPGLPRNAQLKALGNGVVPQQAALAVVTLHRLASVAA